MSKKFWLGLTILIYALIGAGLVALYLHEPQEDPASGLYMRSYAAEEAEREEAELENVVIVSALFFIPTGIGAAAAGYTLYPEESRKLLRRLRELQ